MAGRILVEEHRLYPEAIRLVLQGGWHVAGRRVVFPPSEAEVPPDDEERGQVLD